MSEPRKDVLKIHFSDNEPCDPRIVTALRHIMEEAGVSRSAAARRLMALGCLALVGQDARQAADTVLRGKAREMWSIARLLQASGQGSDSEARFNVIPGYSGEFDSASVPRSDEGSTGKVDRAGKRGPEVESIQPAHARARRASPPAAVPRFSEDKQASVSDRAENDSRMTQPISKLSRVLVKFRDANKPSADEPNE